MKFSLLLLFVFGFFPALANGEPVPKAEHLLQKAKQVISPKIEMQGATLSEALDFLAKRIEELESSTPPVSIVDLNSPPPPVKRSKILEFRFHKNKWNRRVDYERLNISIYTAFTEILAKFDLTYKIVSPDRITIIDAPAREPASK